MPTSGLDSTASLEVLQSLKDVSRLGVTVVFVIHQTRHTLFRLFDDVLLLGVGGKTVCFGPTNDALPYFESQGFDCPEFENAADFFLDVISGSVPHKTNLRFKPSDLVDMWKERTGVESLPEPSEHKEKKKVLAPAKGQVADAISLIGASKRDTFCRNMETHRTCSK